MVELHGGTYVHNGIGYEHTLQDVTGHGHTLQDVTGHEHTLQDVTGHEHTLQDVTGHGHTLQDVTGHGHTLQDVIGYEHTLQDVIGCEHKVLKNTPYGVNRQVVCGGTYLETDVRGVHCTGDGANSGHCCLEFGFIF